MKKVRAFHGKEVPGVDIQVTSLETVRAKASLDKILYGSCCAYDNISSRALSADAAIFSSLSNTIFRRSEPTDNKTNLTFRKSISLRSIFILSISEPIARFFLFNQTSSTEIDFFQYLTSILNHLVPKCCLFKNYDKESPLKVPHPVKCPVLKFH